MKLRLVKLYPEQVAKHWTLLAPMVESTLPPMTTPGNRRSLKLLESLLSGTMTMHQFYEQNEDESVHVLGFMITLVSDSVDGTGKDCFVYCVYGYEAWTITQIIQAIALTKVYAKGEGCNAITALTNVPMIIAWIKRMKGSADYTFIRLEA